MPALLIAVRFLEGRYHGRPDWPPAPARLFQALLAGAAEGDRLPEPDRAALAWLERLPPPVIVAPPARRMASLVTYVPNNDLDSVGGQLQRIGEIRTAKTVRPFLFDAAQPLLYAWTFADGDEAAAQARHCAAMAEAVYQLGRGVDMAWASGEILTAAELDDRLATAAGAVHRPGHGEGGQSLPCPQPGSLDSLVARHRQGRQRFGPAGGTDPVYAKPPPARFRHYAYDCPPARFLFDLAGPAAPWPCTGIVRLTELVRDAAARRLTDALPDHAGLIERLLVGRGAGPADKAQRMRILPLPSIGHAQADRAIRRVLVQVPPDCPLPPDEVERAFSGAVPLVDEDGEIRLELVPALSRSMLRHLGVEEAPPRRLWRSVTPAALQSGRRRIPPERRREDAKDGSERAREEAAAEAAVRNALRQAGLDRKVTAIHVQREPFDAKGTRAEAFAPASRFAKERLWHVEISFLTPLDGGRDGPVAIGDGRYLGLGLMAPRRDAARAVFAYAIDPACRPPAAERVAVLRAVRRALMARARDVLGSPDLPALFSGHEANGAPARDGSHRHLFLAAAEADGRLSAIYVVAPWRVDRQVKPAPDAAEAFDRVAGSLAEVRAGRLGRLRLHPQAPDEADDPLLGSGRHWRLATPYARNRHPRRPTDAVAALQEDIATACRRLGLPAPQIAISQEGRIAASVVEDGIALSFRRAVRGPILLGRGAHFGLGAFQRTE